MSIYEDLLKTIPSEKYAKILVFRLNRSKISLPNSLKVSKKLKKIH